MCELDREVEDLHSERSSVLAQFCKLLSELFGDDEEDTEN